jgi:hypothetical protein
MGRRKCRVILTLIVAGSIALTGCKKEADQIVSKPLDTVKGSAIASSPSPSVRHSPTPSPSASPATELTDGQALGRWDLYWEALRV